ncbi:MAG TPA: helix-turn-helix domain-containing protein [Pseudonocardiaceae bacterium]|nr:helix-turn-helix domain-containing protein [Pseudonocardiaceae bacterium]
MVSVRTVLDMSELRLTALAGQDLLDRVISRIYGTELPDPSRFLSGGELVISGLLWLREPDDVPVFVAALSDAGVAALVCCDADTGIVPPELVAECRRRGVPLLEADVELPFSLIIDRVGLALAAERVGAHVSRRGLVSAMAGGAGVGELLRLGVAELGAACWVVSTLGRLVAGDEPLGEQRRARLVSEFLLGNGRVRTVRSEGADLTLFPVDDPSGPELTRWFLVVDGAVPSGDEVVAELASVLGVQRARERESRHVAARAVDTLLELVLAGSGEIVSTASAAGLDAGVELRVLAASAPGFTVAQAGAVLEEVVALLRPDGLVGSVGEDAYALLPWPASGGGELADRIGVALRTVEPGLGDRRIVVGISSATALRELTGAMQEAGHARQMAERRGGRTRVVAGEEIAAHQLLLAVLPGELRGSLRRRVLGPVLDYDAEHGGSLLTTLAVFLDCSGSWAKAAARLHVHVNTLRYRIGRIEELADVDLDDFGQRVDVYLALNAEP